MVLVIQPEESVRSFVERNLFINGKHSSDDAFRMFPKSCPSTADLLKISGLLGWSGCQGFNRLLHGHTDYPIGAVFKNTQDISYSSQEYIVSSHCFGSDRIESGFCPVCVQEDVQKMGFSFWRRAHCSELKVCAKHNVMLVKHCPVCGLRFSHGGHDLSVL